jgi:molybdopterin-guanine dinucleotide biosynthesis adapter protein
MKLIGLAGWSGAGKTTLLTRLIPCLAARGIGVSTLKHAHHRFDVDTPGKDSWLHREAGARQVLVASEHRWALMTENRGAPEPDLRFLLSRLSPVDLVIVEGFKRDSHPKVEVHRAANGKPWIHPEDPHVAAVASDTRPAPGPLGDLPWSPLDDTESVADLVQRFAVDLAAWQG